MGLLGMITLIGVMLVVAAARLETDHVKYLRQNDAEERLFQQYKQQPRTTLVGVHYFAGWYPGPWSHWLYPTEPLLKRKSWVPDYPGRIPLGGNYTTNQSTVEADLADADRYGIDFFEVLWSDPVVVGGGGSCDGGHDPTDPNYHPCVDIGLVWMLNTSIWSDW